MKRGVNGSPIFPCHEEYEGVTFLPRPITPGSLVVPVDSPDKTCFLFLGEYSAPPLVCSVLRRRGLILFLDQKNTPPSSLVCPPYSVPPPFPLAPERNLVVFAEEGGCYFAWRGNWCGVAVRLLIFIAKSNTMVFKQR